MVDMYHAIEEDPSWANVTIPFNGTATAISPLFYQIPRVSVHLLSTAANGLCIVRFWQHQPRFPKVMIYTMNGCFVVIGALGIPELLRDIHLLEFANGTVLLIITVLIPRCLTFVVWTSSLSIQRFIVKFTLNAAATEFVNSPLMIVLTCLFNIVISFVVFFTYTFVLFAVDGYIAGLIGMLIPVAYAAIGFLASDRNISDLTFYSSTQIDDKFTKVERLTVTPVIDTSANVISSLRLYQRSSMVINFTMIIVFVFMCGLILNTVAASMGGLIISLFLTISLASQQRRRHRSDAVREIRIIVCHIWFRYATAIVGRLILIYYQIFSISWTGSCTGYLTSLYEKQRIITVAIAVISISTVELLGNFAAYLYAYELLTIQQHYILLFGYAWGSAICITFICVVNLRIMKDLKKGARIDSYSINRTYQIRENLKVIENLIQFVGPTVILNIPCFLFYGMYAFLPQRLHTYRYFGAEFYDVSTVLYGIAYTMIMNIRLLDLTGREIKEKSSTPEGDIYFMQLNAQFKLPLTNQ
ncbi:hypothetical protein PRIPAC_77113 [Pristionchus pacificus]|uniref:Uncharacterized protein n=1 Tax=Pristionchus pacificus TaxID=54126 RepID=A0A2A6C2B8_PRIPA|nr:hypothetical protein PRIPAC_77113 [Pristionchus pacificus]|eukprot:PDM72315.1 hypothetical protein PRIPAC_38749 [Pristionchus pacificus]